MILVCRHLVGLPGRMTGPSHGTYLHQTTQILPTIPLSKRPKTAHILDRTANVIWTTYYHRVNHVDQIDRALSMHGGTFNKRIKFWSENCKRRDYLMTHTVIRLTEFDWTTREGSTFP